jgi:hypothetical protein
MKMGDCNFFAKNGVILLIDVSFGFSFVHMRCNLMCMQE